MRYLHRKSEPALSQDRTVLIVLAGGRSARFGASKGLFLFEGQPLIGRVIDTLHPLTGRVLVCVAPGEFQLFKDTLLGNDIEFVEDSHAYMGPLSALSDALKLVDEEIALLAPCDMPFLSPQLYPLLIKRLDKRDAAVPIFNYYPEPITAVYRAQSLIGAVDMELRMRRGKLSGILPHLDYIAVSEDEWKRAGIDPRCFTNLNTLP